MSKLESPPSTILESPMLIMKQMMDGEPSSSSPPTDKNLTFVSAGFMFPFERPFQSVTYVDDLIARFGQNWKYCYLFSFLYVVVIFSIKAVMSKRASRFELRTPLILWNIALASFSILGVIRVWPEFLDAIFNKGVVYSVCDLSYGYGATGFWTCAFIFSKLPELIDTVFIVLRKQPLIFLHWYHHITVLCYCWYSYADRSASGRWFMAMNYFVHALMYSYYALKAMKIRVPVAVSKMITILQLSQMIFGCYVNWVAYRTKLNAPEANCKVSDDNIFYSFLMYLSYFLLFFKFFLDAYVTRNAKFASQAKKGNESKSLVKND